MEGKISGLTHLKKSLKVAHSIRAHWQIENALHWSLDVVFHEDQNRARARHAAKNLGTLRAICLNLIKRIPGKLSMKAKRFQAALNNNFLVIALQNLDVSALGKSRRGLTKYHCFNKGYGIIINPETFEFTSVDGLQNFKGF